MTSHESPTRRDVRPAEAASGSDADSERAERLYGCGTPMPDKLDEWEPYSMRKHHSGMQSAYGVLRNDRTPLNTPCTPAVVKLQLKRHDELDGDGEQATPPARALVATIRASVLHLMMPLRYARSVVDPVITRLLPAIVVQSAVFARHRGWVAWYLTTVLCIPFVLLLSPIVITLCICTSPVWIAGGVILVLRACVLPSPKLPAPALVEEYVHSPGPHHRVNGTRGVNGVSSANLRHHHHHHHHHHTHASYQRTTLSPNDVVDG